MSAKASDFVAPNLKREPAPWPRHPQNLECEAQRFPAISRWPCGSPVTPMSVSSARAADIIPRVAQGSLRRRSGPSLLVAPMPVDDDLAKRQSEEQCRGQGDIQGALSANRTRVIGLPAAKRWRAR